MDTDSRDSLACDLMEPVRPQVDSYLLEWILKRPVRREWFVEQRDGSCRLKSSFAAEVSQTAPTWARAVAPLAEQLCKSLWSTARRPQRQFSVATPLTQDHRRAAKGKTGQHAATFPKPPNVGKTCGIPVRNNMKYCDPCAAGASTESLVEAAKLGRIAAHTPEAERKRSETQHRQNEARRNWRPSDLPEWLNEKVFREHIQPRLRNLTFHKISEALGVSDQYSILIRNGKRIPHPRHWQVLARLVEQSTSPPSVR